MDQPQPTARRTVLKRAALIGGATVWTTPIVQSVAASALAVGGSDPAATGSTHVFRLRFTRQSPTGVPVPRFVSALPTVSTCYRHLTDPEHAYVDTPAGVIAPENRPVVELAAPDGTPLGRASDISPTNTGCVDLRFDLPFHVITDLYWVPGSACRPEDAGVQRQPGIPVHRFCDPTTPDLVQVLMILHVQRHP